MNKITGYIYIGLTALVIIFYICLGITLRDRRNIESKWKDTVENCKAYELQYNDSEERNIAFKLTIDQLQDSKDSVFRELNKVRNELKIKDSKLRNLLYMSSNFTKTDTITLQGDTIFRDAKTSIDTLLSDEWYSVRVGLCYPSTIVVEPKFRSVKNIVVSAKRETVNPPKRFFLLRWFQKKHTVLAIDVVEKNPYVQNQAYRYVEIIR